MWGFFVGVIAVTIFAVVLKRIEDNNPQGAIRTLTTLIGTSLGGGGSDFAVANVFLHQNGIPFYVMGFTALFLALGLPILFQWLRRQSLI